MFSAIKGYFFGGSPEQQSQNTIKEKKPLKSDVSNPSLDSLKNSEKKRTIIKGENNKFDFSEEYDEDEPKTTSENSSSNEKENKLNHEIELNPAQKIDNMDYWRMAHCVYVKNSLININTFSYVPFIKLKKKKEGILSYIGFGSESFYEAKYLVGFDEHFIYMIDLTKEENKNDNDAMKTIGNHYDITKISNIEIVEDNSKNKILVTVLFVLDNDVDNFNSKIKKFFFEKPNALKFINLLKAYLSNYKIKITFNDKVFGNIKFNDFDKTENEEKNKKQEKIVETKEIKVEDKNEENKKEEKEDNEEEKEDNEEEKEDNEEEEKKDKEVKEEEVEKKEKKEVKEEEEIFTSENVEEKDVQKENKNLIDI